VLEFEHHHLLHLLLHAIHHHLQKNPDVVDDSLISTQIPKSNQNPQTEPEDIEPIQFASHLSITQKLLRTIPQKKKLMFNSPKNNPSMLKE
jgi:hypothetical protein